MSIRSLLMPAISQRLLSRSRVLTLRAHAEKSRLAKGLPHQVYYFHQVDDPYSALAAQCLKSLCARYTIELKPHIVAPPADSAAPERDKLVAYSRQDAQRLAHHHRLVFQDNLMQPSLAALDLATRTLLGALQAGQFTAAAASVCDALWNNPSTLKLANPSFSIASESATKKHLVESTALRKRLGHYLGAMFYYAGEWYWGIDRLYHLEQRLQDLGAQKPNTTGYLFKPHADLQHSVSLPNPPDIEFFVSLRSPYSAIVAPRIYTLARRTGAKVKLRYVLPMVMRGLPIPKEKRRYISQDAAREAHVRGIPFGRLNDPVGKPTERGLALMPLAISMGKEEDYLLSFMHGVWAEGIDAGSDKGLRKIVERAGLPWSAATEALQDESWRKVADENRETMFGLGLWGVPSFKVGNTATWGQDRLWCVEAALL